MGADGKTDPAAGGSVLTLPAGGGAISGLGETFSPDLFTGTGNFSVPIAVPAGRRGLQPRLTLAYSTGTGNGPYGLGWSLSLPGVSRKTSRGVPRYADGSDPAAADADVFVLSGAEDLVPVAGSYPGRVRYRPRTEGLFARIEHVRDASGDFWEVRGRDGTTSRYGTARPDGAPAGWRDPAAVADPVDPRRILSWRITGTRDPLGNLIRYEYGRDAGAEPGHAWDQPVLSRVSYADYGDRADPAFLVRVEFEYEPRPDAFSDHRGGFEVRTSLRCRTIRVGTDAADGVARTSRECRLSYQQAEFTGVSLLARVDVVGIDGAGVPPGTEPATQSLPPLTFGYSGFDPAGRRFAPVTGPGLPAAPLSDPALALVDLRGAGLPDLVELGSSPRYWRNAGGGRFELPRALAGAPPHRLADPGVQLMDADGDGRPDLVVTAAGAAGGYFPMSFAGGWSRRSFQPYRQLPSVSLADPTVRLVDLDGDGRTDVLRSGGTLQCWFNDADPRRAWQRTAVGTGSSPDLDLSDPRVRLADMTGDGLADLVLLRSGNIAYWPSLGHGRWGPMVSMRHAPRLPDGHDPRRLLLGDVDGDGACDLVYVEDGRVLLWGNRSGDAWTEQPIAVPGTPGVLDTDTIRLVDLHGTGMAGLLFGRTTDAAGRPGLRFLDLTGGVKPYLLETMDNQLGARTRVTYRPSTVDFLRDQADPATRWRTTLPFPVHVVAGVEVLDAISGGRQTTEYRYHHGYWDGLEREFRGFAMVEQQDAETVPAADGSSPPPRHSPPTLTRTWFHPGPVAAAEAGDWTELDLRPEYWAGDPPMLSRPAALTAFLAGLPRAVRRSALRALRGQSLRTELYALDGTDRADRPYTVTETLCAVREESPLSAGAPAGRERIFYPFAVGRRSTQWERGDEPMTRFVFPAGHDEYGFPAGQLDVAVPRGRDPLAEGGTAAQPYLATYGTTEFARRDEPGLYLVDRVARVTSYEVVHDGRLPVTGLRDAVLAGSAGVSLRVIGHSRTYYDGDAFTGLPLGTLGEHGLPVRTESLAFTDAFLDDLHGPDDPLWPGGRPVYLDPGGVTGWPPEYPVEFRTLLADLAGYRHYADADVAGSPGGYYLVTARHRYDVHEPGRVPRGLPLSSLDPLGAASRVDYDQHDLLPVRSVDPAGLETVAVQDYRILQPRQLTDPNGTTTAVTYTPAGLVDSQYVRGADGAGDREQPAVRISYDLLAFAERGRPASVRRVRRVHHDADPGVPADRRDDVLVSVEFSDGLGRTLQTRSVAEDSLFGDPAFGGGVLPVDQSVPVGDAAGRTRGPSDPDNVIVSGWQVYDNKGRVVRRYEPFFSTGLDYAEPADAQLGQSSTIFYDPRGQAVRTVGPDGSEQRVVLGVPAELTDPDRYAPTPWESYTYDANDNAGRTHGAAAGAYQSHWNTPASVEVDALGRVVRAVTRTGTGPGDELTTRSSYDIHGNVVSISDALGREAFRYVFDLAKRRWRTDSMDGGRRDAVPDALGDPVETRDSKGAVTLAVTDLLHRPSRVWARDDAAGAITLRQRVEYGDGGVADQPAAERAAARAGHLLGRPVRHHDEAGLVTVAAVDFKGNVLETTRQVVADAPILATYQDAAANGWQVRPFRVDWTPAPGQSQADRDAELLQPAGYSTTTGYDALNRVVRHVFPTDVEGRRRELLASYNRAGALDQVRLDGTVQVRRIVHDAKGQRALIAYGNGVLTRYAYDPHTFRLARLRSENYTLVDDATYRPNGTVLQDHGYDYDLVGNVLTVRERTPGAGIPVGPDPSGPGTGPPGGPDALDRRFDYDPVYRLVAATGREHRSPPAGDPWLPSPRGTDVTQTQAYRETYRYDAAGSLVELVHTGAGGFTREYAAEPGSNRLRRMTIGTTPYDYEFDANGNLTAETTTRHFAWNHADQLAAFATQTEGAEPSVHAQYLYDATGQRVTKLVRRQGGAVEVTHYLEDTFEHHRWSGPQAGENDHVHLLDDRQRVALVRIGPAHPDDRGPDIAVHLADHLGSSTAVVDGGGAVTNREEYTPYGETSFGSFARKRYRFTGCERDEESGLGHHGVRCYLPWTARWASCDPVAPTSGLNAFQYGRSSPMRFTDTAGTEDKDVAAIGKMLQDIADNLAPALRRGPGETASPFGTRLHDMLQGITESAPMNYPGVDTSRVATEVIVDKAGIVVGYGGKPGGAPKGAVTADAVILNKGLSADGIIGKEAADVIHVGIDYKTGGARLALKQRLLFAKIGKPLLKLTAGGDLAKDMAAATSRGQRGFATLGMMGRIASVGLIALVLFQDFSLSNATELAKGLVVQEAFTGTATAVLGRTALKSGGLVFAFFSGMRSDNAQFSKEQEELEIREAGEKALNDLAGNYWDAHPGITMAQARQHIVDGVIAQHEADERRAQAFWKSFQPAPAH